MPKVEQTYLGDGAYASFDGYSLWVATHDGYRTTNRVCLEPDILRNLLQYIKTVAGTNDKVRANLSSLMFLFDAKKTDL